MKLKFTPEQWQTFRDEDTDGCYDCRNDGLEAVFQSMSTEQLREFASGLLSEANRREGYEEISLDSGVHEIKADLA